MSKEYGPLEEYIEIFQYNLQRSLYTTLHKDMLKTMLLRGMKDEWIEMLNLMGRVTFLKWNMMTLWNCVSGVPEEVQEPSMELAILSVEPT